MVITLCISIGLSCSPSLIYALIFKALNPMGLIQCGIGGLAVGGYFFFRNRRYYIQPILKISDELHRAEKGDLSKNFTPSSTKEIALLAQELNSFLNTMRKNLVHITSNSITLTNTSKDLSEMSTSISNKSAQMCSQSETVASIGENASKNILTISESAQHMHSSINSIVGSIENMNSSINDVALSCRKESEIVNQATHFVKNTKDGVSRLHTSAKEIGRIVDVINGIADKTNLLSLNATIEAASAGEEGKGFAVVANEIKILARQSATATEEIEQQIKKIQYDTVSVVNAVNDIASIIEEVHTISQSIVQVIEEQSTTILSIYDSIGGVEQSANTMNSNIKESALGLSEVSTKIVTINNACKEASGQLEESKNNAATVATVADSLQKAINQFKLSSNKKRIGDYLIELGFITKDQLQTALNAQQNGDFPGMRLGDVLVATNIISRKQFDVAVKKKIAEESEG